MSDAPGPARVATPKTRPAKAPLQSWSAYTGPQKCDHCLLALADDPTAPPARVARKKLVDRRGTWLLCGAHAEEAKPI